MKISNKFIKNILILIILFNFFAQYLISPLGVNGSIIFLNDLLLVLAVALTMVSVKEKKNKDVYKNIYKFSIFLFFILVLYFIEQVIAGGFSPLHFIWGFRNNFRYFIYMICCAIIFDKEDAEKIIKIFNYMIIPILILTSYQFFVKGLFQDFIGGTFGEMYGSTAYLNVYLFIFYTINCVKYFSGETKITNLTLCTILTLYIATLSEIKIYYFELIIIFILSFLFTKKNIKKSFSIFLIAVLLISFISFFTSIYGFNNFFTIDGIEKYISGNYSTTEINRATVFKSVNENIFLFVNNSNPLLGIGLGNGETSSLEIFNTYIYTSFGERIRYIWFSSAFMYLETGILGIFLYALIYIYLYIKIINIKNKIKNNKAVMFANISKILIIMNAIMFFYNTTLREECAFFIFILLAFPFVYDRKEE